LTVQALHGGALGEASHESCGTELSGTTTGGKDGADGNVLDSAGVNAALVQNSLEDTGKQVSASGILEATLTTLGEGCAQGTCHDNVIGVLLGDSGGSLLATRAEVGGNLVKTLLGYR
jgi:hypothetical protein